MRTIGRKKYESLIFQNLPSYVNNALTEELTGTVFHSKLNKIPSSPNNFIGIYADDYSRDNIDTRTFESIEREAYGGALKLSKKITY